MPRRFPDDEGFDKVNFVTDSWTTGCDAPWYIYIETMKPAALEAFIVLLSFGWADVARGAFRPKGLGRRTGKRKGRWNRRLPRFPEVGNAIGKGLPFGEQIQDYVKWSAGAKNLWLIDNALQAGLFWWLVADVAEDFAFNWTSLLYESYWCQPDPPGRFSYYGSGLAPTQDNVWKVAAFPHEDYEYPPPAWAFNSGSSGPNGCQVTAAMSIERRPPFDPPTEFRVVIWNEDLNKAIDDGPPTQLDADGKGDGIMSSTVPPNTVFGVRSWMSGTSYANLTGGVVLGVETRE